jgi:long-chain fatty acid transport protein
VRALAIVLLFGATARANPIDAFGFGARGGGMANAGAAVSDDASANYYNPAGLVHGRETRIDIGYRVSQPFLKMNGRDVGVDASRGFAVGIAAPGHISKFRFAFGVGLFLPDQRVTRVRSLPYEQPRFVYYDNRIQRIFLTANLALQIIPGLYVGAGITFMSRTQGTVNLRGIVAVTNADESQLQTKIDVDLVAVRYPQAGIWWDATRWVTLAVTYRHSFRLDLDQAFRVDGSVGNPGLPPIVAQGYFAARVLNSDMFQPWQLTAAAAVRLLKPLLVTVELTYARWSEFPTPASQLSIGLDVGQFNSMVHIPPPRNYAAPFFHDIVIPRVATEWRARDSRRLGIDVRFGYSYEPTPVPEQIFDSNLADSDKHTFSTGIGLELRKLDPILAHPLTLDAHLAVTYLPDRANHKLDPLDKVGDFTAGGAIVSFGLGMRLKF